MPLDEAPGRRPEEQTPGPADGVRDLRRGNPVDEPSLSDRLRAVASMEAFLGVAPGQVSKTTDWGDARPTGQAQGGARPQPELPGYEVLGELGRGAMGVVYLARQVSLGRVVAIKRILAREHATDAEVARFGNEARAVARARHPNIVQVYDVGEHEGLPYIVLEYVRGGSLDRRLSGSTVAPEAAARFLEPLARAVHAAHERGVVHRDLKPANILIDGDDGGGLGPPKVSDFGLAKLLNFDSSLTTPGAVMGSPCYMSPEQAEGKSDEVGPPADVYALGAILYELLTGRPPFRGASAIDTIQQVRHSTPTPPSRLAPGLSRDLETIVLKCLEKEPSRRYGSAAAMAEDLRRWLEHQPIAARPAGPLTRARLWRRRRPALAALAIALASTLVGATAVSSVLATLAIHAQARANQEAEEARRERDRSEALRYVAEINLAQRDAEGNNFKEMRRRLAELVPAGPDDVDPRGFEWHYLDGLLDAGLLTLGAPSTDLTTLEFSPDGRTLATVGGGVARIWDASSGRLISMLPAQAAGGGYNCLAFAPDGRTFVTAGEDGALRVWDAATGLPIFHFRAGPGSITRAVFAPHGRSVATTHSQTRTELGTARTWDVATGRPLATFRDDSSDVSCLDFSPDGFRLVTGGSYDQTTTIWEAATGRKLETFRSGVLGHVGSVAFSPDGARIVSAGRDVRVLESDSGAEVAVLSEQRGLVSDVAFAPDGRSIAAAYRDGSALIWDIAARRLVAAVDSQAPASRLAFSPDGRRIAVGGSDGSVRVWDAASGDDRARIRTDRSSFDMATFSPDGRTITALNGGELRSWDVATGRLKAIRVMPDREMPWIVDYAPDGRSVAMAGAAVGTTRIWDPTAGRMQRVLRGHAGAVQALKFSPDGTAIATAGDDRTIRMWDASNGRPGVVLGGHEAAVSGLAFHPGGRYLASGGVDAPLRIWDAATGRLVRLWDAHPGGALPLAFSPDGRTLATVGWRDGEVRIWDAASGRRLFVLRSDKGGVDRLCYAPDGSRIVTADSGGTLKFWDARNGRELLAIPGEARPDLAGEGAKTNSIAFSPDGKLLAVAGDGLRLLDASTITIAVRARREAVSLVRFWLDRSDTYEALRDGLTRDRTVPDEVRTLALEEGPRFWESRLLEQAASAVDAEYDRGLLRHEAVASIRDEAGLDPRVRTLAVDIAEVRRESPPALAYHAWEIVRRSDARPGEYGRAFRLARRADEIRRESGLETGVLGMAAYRLERYAEALDALARAVAADPEYTAPESAFLAMTLFQLGRREESLEALARARRLIGRVELRGDLLFSAPTGLTYSPGDCRTLVAEAERLIHAGPILPLDVFAP